MMSLIEAQYFGAMFIIGIIFLIKLTWQDYTNNRNVDERDVRYILGAMSVIIAVQAVTNSLLFAFGMILVSIVISALFGGFLKLGSPDQSLISGMQLLFLVTSPLLGVVFLGTLLSVTVLYLLWNKLLVRQMPRPYLPVLLITWVVMGALMTFGVVV